MRERPHSGFSLIELVVVVAIIGTLMAMLLAGVQRVRAAAQRADCANRLRQIALASHQHHDAFHRFPPGHSWQDGKSPFPHLSWQARLLPFVEQLALWEATRSAFAQNREFWRVPPHGH